MSDYGIVMTAVSNADDGLEAYQKWIDQNTSH